MHTTKNHFGDLQGSQGGTTGREAVIPIMVKKELKNRNPVGRSEMPENTGHKRKEYRGRDRN